MGIFANTLLFLSTLLILIDLSPLDFLPKTKKRRRAIQALQKATNIFKSPENGITIRPENSKMRMEVDDRSFALLKSLIEQHSEYSHEVDWEQVLGIGYSTISLPVDKIPLPAFRPLYVAIAPTADSSTMSLLRVGQFEDLSQWITGWRRGPLTWTAVGFLSLGYLLQLISIYLQGA
jgi:hypothetical protein